MKDDYTVEPRYFESSRYSEVKPNPLGLTVTWANSVILKPRYFELFFMPLPVERSSEIRLYYQFSLQHSIFRTLALRLCRKCQRAGTDCHNGLTHSNPAYVSDLRHTSRNPQLVINVWTKVQPKPLEIESTGSREKRLSPGRSDDIFVIVTVNSLVGDTLGNWKIKA